MNATSIHKIEINRKAEQKISTGYLWVFSNEIKKIPQIDNGSIVQIIGESGKNFGLGYFNRSSLISIRILKTNAIPDVSFFVDRISNAEKLRNMLLPKKQCFRLVFGESDFLPGLIIDKYSNYFAIQILSAGMQKSLPLIIEALMHLYPETIGIIEKNRSRLRSLEGLELYDKICYGMIQELIETEEFGMKLKISLLESQKTGYFLDQSINRLFIRNMASDLKVCDCFANQAGFAINASIGNAQEVIAIDASLETLNLAKVNAQLNNCNNIRFLQEDVFDYLSSNSNNQFDLIILDPPSFTKSKNNIPTAKSGYLKLNRLALRNIKSGGFLASSSCSQHISEDVFYQIIINSAYKEKRQLRLIHRSMQSPDHPILASMPETNYLKFLVFQVF